MTADKLQNAFEAAYVEEMVRVYGEAIRGAAQVAIDHKMPNGEYAAPMLRLGLWAWKASRAAVVVQLPELHTIAPDDDRKWHGCRNSTIRTCARAVEAAGLKVKS